MAMPFRYQKYIFAFFFVFDALPTVAASPSQNHSETKMNLRFKTCLAGLLALGISAASAQTFPSQPVRLISPFPGGSGPDAVTRIVGERLSAAWKQPVLVDPRPGASGFIAASAVKQAAPTGYDLLVADVGVLSVNPSLFKSLPYDPKADFVPVGGFLPHLVFRRGGQQQPHPLGEGTGGRRQCRAGQADLWLERRRRAAALRRGADRRR
jgi:hypothetical protein